MTAGLGGLDALVFTGGVGEHSPPVRELACRGLEFLGVRIDAHANARADRDQDVSAAESETSVLVIAAREDLEIARGVREVLGKAPR